MTALCWLNWVFKHRFDKTVREKCLPVVARLPLIQLEKHRQMVPGIIINNNYRLTIFNSNLTTENVYSDILAMKLRTSYNQVFFCGTYS
jgi:hypothetical protein